MWEVTPLVGVWIEIVTDILFILGTERHSPCGSVDWNIEQAHSEIIEQVTPLVGVWIEITNIIEYLQIWFVTPLVGVWIEIKYWYVSHIGIRVTPLVGVWIEIYLHIIL